MGRKIGSNFLSLLLAAFLIGNSLGGCNDQDGPEKEMPRISSLPSTAEILFVSNRDTGSSRTEIYAMDKEGDNVTRITYTEEFHFILGIDPTRRYLADSRAEEDTNSNDELDGGDRRTLWLIDLETKQETRLTDLGNHAEGDSFSPDGEWIVFLMKLPDPDSVMDIYKIRRDGTDLTNLTDTPTVIEGDPSWSNDGRSIVYAAFDMDVQRFVLKKMDADGGNAMTVYDGGPGVATPVFPAGNYDPNWSPDDQWIVFERATAFEGENFGSGIWHIFKVKVDGSEVEDLSSVGGHEDRAEYLPSFSPDGQFIVFGSIYEADPLADSHNDIFRMDADGSSLVRLTHHPANDMYPVWIR
ncbi:MAG: hypothetical protein GTO14_00175 [Anaerolineales bacterium]|nr:hypothetical protein [Anaerolineales bacterium]